MIYNNTTKSKFAYEVEALNPAQSINKNLGEFATMKEARAAIKSANLPSDTLVTVWKHKYHPQTTSFNSSVESSKLQAEFETA